MATAALAGPWSAGRARAGAPAWQSSAVVRGGRCGGCFARLRRGGVDDSGRFGPRNAAQQSGRGDPTARGSVSGSRKKGWRLFAVAAPSQTFLVGEIAEPCLDNVARAAVAKMAEDMGTPEKVPSSKAVGALSASIQAEQRCSSLEPEAADDQSPTSQEETQKGRRQALAATLLALLWIFPMRLLADEGKNDEGEKEQSAIGGLLSLFDPNETSKLGIKLPKAYLKSARDVVQTLRASFSEDAGNDAKFRRNADSAKGAIREYISNWKDAKLVGAEQSHQALERALRVLGEFYSKKGPRAALPEDVRARVLADLQTADDAL